MTYLRALLAVPIRFSYYSLEVLDCIFALNCTHYSCKTVIWKLVTRLCWYWGMWQQLYYSISKRKVVWNDNEVVTHCSSRFLFLRHRHCRRRRYVFGLSVRRVSPFVRFNRSYYHTISHERLDWAIFMKLTGNIH